MWGLHRIRLGAGRRTTRASAGCSQAEASGWLLTPWRVCQKEMVAPATSYRPSEVRQQWVPTPTGVVSTLDSACCPQPPRVTHFYPRRATLTGASTFSSTAGEMENKYLSSIAERAAGAGPRTMESRSPGAGLSARIYQGSLPRGRHAACSGLSAQVLVAAELAVVQARLKLQSPLAAISRALYK